MYEMNLEGLSFGVSSWVSSCVGSTPVGRLSCCVDEGNVLFGFEGGGTAAERLDRFFFLCYYFSGRCVDKMFSKLLYKYLMAL